MSLNERLQQTTDATTWPGKIPMNYLYTAGRAGEKFFRTIKDKGAFIGTKCGKCGGVYVPARIFCEKCFERIEGNVVKVPNRGVVHTFTVCHEDYQEKAKAKPSIVALIRLEGTIGGLMHWIGAVKPEQVHIGMRVKAVFKPKTQRKGGILDIKHFVPA